MADNRRSLIGIAEGQSKKAQVIEFPGNPKARQAVVYCSTCKKQFPVGYNFNFCPDCGRALILLKR